MKHSEYRRNSLNSKNMLEEIIKQINEAVKELNEEGIKCSFNGVVTIKDNTEG